MNVYITKLNGMFFMSTRQYMQHMVVDIAHPLGIREMGVYRYNTKAESVENRGCRLDGIIAGINAGDVVICQIPTGNGLEFERVLIRRIKDYRGRIVMFVHNMEAIMEENLKGTLQDTIRMYNEAEVLIVPSYRMKQFLLTQGIRRGMKFVVQEIQDYMTQLGFLDSGKLKREFHFAGNPDRFPFLNEWDYEVPLNVYSDQECIGKHVQRMGWMPSNHLLLELSRGGFGLVWYGNEYGHCYLSMNSSLKLSAYLAAGIPVIVPRGLSNQCMIEENHLGIAVDTLDEAVETVKSMTGQEYQGYISAISRFAPLLRQGFFTKKCLVDALQMIMRKDMYAYSESDVVCTLPEGKFEYVCLKASYGGNLALSWTFRGEAEGFLIYDADSGRLAGEVCDGLGHYLLLKNQPQGIRLMVKAYVRTLRGKIITAESDVVAVSEKTSGQNLVSLIMPAYNAREYIARSIDTALAQSFTDMEVIIVDDGSTDETRDIIQWYKEKYPHIKFFCQPNGGQASARNTGIRHAAGKYISFMDNDDMLRPDMIERLYGAVTKNDCDVAMTSVYMLREEGYEEMATYFMEEDTAVSIDEFLHKYITLSPVIWNKLYRASLVKERPLAVDVTYEDDAWTPYVLSYARRVCYINAHLYEYDRQIRNVTAIHASWRKSIEERFLDHRQFLMFFLENGNLEKRPLLKQLALRYVASFMNSYSYPKYRELKQEIEQM